jgi:hypothetical protein
MQIVEKHCFNSAKAIWLRRKIGCEKLQRRKDGLKSRSKDFPIKKCIIILFFRLGNRQASQGVVAVHARDNVGALLELNCETDFVARNSDFKNLVCLFNFCRIISVLL